MTRVRGWISQHKASSLIIVGTLALLILGASYVGVARATDQPSFCRAACHEMEPYHAAWSQGPHKDVACVSCHVDPGPVAGLKHKLVALKEVSVHVSGDVSFPRAGLADVPNERCISCHEDISADSTGFSHATHAQRGACIKCHAATGHTVTTASLKAAGIYNAAGSLDPSTDSSTTAVIDGGKANLDGHQPIACSRCHVMAATACSACHKPKHTERGECTTCHRPRATFVFAHPTDRADCQTCHKTAPTHTKINAACSSCHQKPGVAWTFGHPGQASDCTSCHARPAEHRAGACSSCHAAGVTWAFKHPAAGATCTSCHSRPAGHRAGSCTSCHSAGTTWAFRHPGSSATCTSCHNRPSGHRSGSCTRCHGTGSSWSFRHPGSSATCTSCHNRPSGHRSGACTSCHSVGKSWTFRHTSSSSCSSCHKAPSGHYGSTCASCHSPSRAWRSATFSHARIPGGEHTYRSFACVNCHPNGKSTHTCAKCHGSSSGPSDDD